MNIKGKEMIALAIGVSVLVAVIPQSIESISSVNTTNWSAAARSLWDLMPLIIIAVIVMGIAGGVYAKKKGMF